MKANEMQSADVVLRCPKCREIMRQREAKSHYGTKLLLFHCTGCSGIWVDKDVAFAVSRDSALAAESDVQLDDIPTSPRTTEIFCPRCGTNLTEQTGGVLPNGLRIDYCTSCHGFWFDQGELMIYKSFLEEKRKQNAERLKTSEGKRMKEFREKLEREPDVRLSSVSGADLFFVGARILSLLLRLAR